MSGFTAFNKTIEMKMLENMSFIASKPFPGAKGKDVDIFNGYLQGYS
jgi:hypothetical protein